MKTRFFILLALFLVTIISTISARRHVGLQKPTWDMEGRFLGKGEIDAFIDDNEEFLILQFNERYEDVQITVTCFENGYEIYNEIISVEGGSIIDIPIGQTPASYQIVINTKESVFTGFFDITNSYF
jgi:hypothetical protein